MKKQLQNQTICNHILQDFAQIVKKLTE